MALVAFDAQTCIWGIARPYSNGNDPTKVAAVTALTKNLRKHNVNIVIPSTVVSEFIAPLPFEKQREMFDDLNKKYRIAYHDPKATMILGEILNYHHSNKKYQSLGITKTAMKYDAYIIATAISAGAECIYTTDGDFITIAAHFIQIQPDFNKLPASILNISGGALGLKTA
jgi:predicted nucleic acid-binding protein